MDVTQAGCYSNTSCNFPLFAFVFNKLDLSMDFYLGLFFFFLIKNVSSIYFSKYKNKAQTLVYSPRFNLLSHMLSSFTAL